MGKSEQQALIKVMNADEKIAHDAAIKESKRIARNMKAKLARDAKKLKFSVDGAAMTTYSNYIENDVGYTIGFMIPAISPPEESLIYNSYRSVSQLPSSSTFMSIKGTHIFRVNTIVDSRDFMCLFSTN